MKTAGARLALVTLAGLSSASCTVPAALTLHAPDLVAARSRVSPTRVDLEPIADGSTAAVLAPAPIAAPGPAAVLTSAMNAELSGRALAGESHGFSARCTLDRFAIRGFSVVSSSDALTTLYIDLSCEAHRSVDGALVWRGELRARSATSAAILFAGDDGSLETRSSRMLGDAGRELASDLAVRALGLTASPSARVFRDEAAARISSGIDDSPLGPAALAESLDGVRPVLPFLKETELPATRASAWNVVALAAGPTDPWLADKSMSLDRDPYVRFYQYKALARFGTPEARGQLGKALPNEDEPQLAELIRDALASGGIGVARASSATAETNGSTTKP